MRRHLRLVSVCVISVFVSVLYVFEELASSLETEAGRYEPRRERSGRAGGLSQPQSEHRCKSMSVTHWNPYWRLPRDVCGKNCFMESARRYSVDETLSAVLEVGGTEMLRLAVVACGPRLEETLTMLKSAVLFSRRTLQFYIFAEDELHSGFRDALESWPVKFRSKFNYTTYRITFPGDNAKEWKRLFKPCASQRLFLPLILTEVDSLLYVDTDILFLQPVEEIWNFLSRFNSSHLAAMAPEHEEPRIGWYNRFARHPYYGKTGVNSGVMLMNMTRIRAKRFKNDMTTVHLRWSELLMPLLQKYKLNITWGDQDLLNIIFHYNPESLLVFPCHWNYRPDHCIYGSNCAAAERHGVYVLHGNRGVYHDDKQPAFRAVYEAVRKFPFGEDANKFLLKPLEEKLKQTLHTYCGRSGHLFTKRLQQSVRNLQKENHDTR
ncbi:glucoside xylosyltransferase 1 isoform X3 [Tachysurus fulvidraco]|uniref:glucoside xylosyltransferase 1 isoform X3 n=1 Tax=Tachysurus fulvidraco TaxID=1234273 RepID=UPI000F4E5B9F|nr:glucoside xylosyltransferase 1 isoform X3 [Tachysurus fulvidraco]